MRRAAAVLAVVVLLAAAHAAAPLASPRPVLPGEAKVALLGPLRPLVAELVRLRFEATRLNHRVFGQLDDAWTILTLRPERVDAFADFGSYFVLDAPPLLDRMEERGALARAGLDLFEWGRRLHPEAWKLDLFEGYALFQLLRLEPAAAQAAGFGDDLALRSRLLDRCAGAIAHAPPPEDPGRELLRFNVALWLQGMLEQPTLPAALHARAAAEARRLLSWTDLPATLRDALAATLR